MKQALVVYIGRKRGKFSLRMDRYPVREWSIAPRAGLRERWLSVDEAELWGKQRDWMIARTRVLPDPAPAATIKLAEPAPLAKHVSTLLVEAKQQAQQVEEERELDEAGFCLSDNGVVHKTGCVRWPKYPLKTFVDFANAVNDEDYARTHRMCCKAEMVMRRGKTELKEALEQVEGGIAQMNAMGESYGLQATEA